MSEDEPTYGERIAAERDLTVYCHQCDRKVEFDPTNVVESHRPLGARFRCMYCHERDRYADVGHALSAFRHQGES